VKRAICIGFCSVLAFCAISIAQTKPGPAGHWEGSINAPSGALRVVIDFDRAANGAWIGDIDLPDQGVKDMPLKGITVSDNSIAFNLTAGFGDPKFQGKLSDDGNTISGDFIQGPNKVPFSIKRAGEAKVYVPPKNAALPEKFAGKWEGTLDSMGSTLHLVFNLANKDGSASGTIDSPDQGALGLPMSEISTTENSIKISVQIVDGGYTGKLSGDGKVLTGEWSQAGGTLPLVLKKAATAKN
jgi:hypothetical protein